MKYSDYKKYMDLLADFLQFEKKNGNKYHMLTNSY